MSLTPREKWVHMYTVISVIGQARGEPNDTIQYLMESMRNERCRNLSNKEIRELIDEIEEDSIACSNAMDYIMDEMEAQTCGGRNC